MIVLSNSSSTLGVIYCPWRWSRWRIVLSNSYSTLGVIYLILEQAEDYTVPFLSNLCVIYLVLEQAEDCTVLFLHHYWYVIYLALEQVEDCTGLILLHSCCYLPGTEAGVGVEDCIVPFLFQSR